MRGWAGGVDVAGESHQTMGRGADARRHADKGVTGFDRVFLRWAAGRGLLSTLNRGTVKRIDDNSYQGFALAA